MSVIAPIQGAAILNVGSVSAFTDTTAGGTWTSTNSGVATVDASGNVTAVSKGAVQIVYTVGSDSTAINLTVQSASSLTNGINFNKVYNALQNRVLFKSQGAISDSNRYYEDFHTLNDTALLDALRVQDNTTLAAYLTDKQRSVIMGMVNAVYNNPQVIDKPKLVFWKDDQPLPIQLTANQGQFVGLRLYVGKGDHAIKLNSLQLLFNQAVSFNLYLYNDFLLNPVMTIPVSAQAYNEVIIDLGETVILNNLVPTQYKNGMWYLGYFQNDLGSTQAIYYPVRYSSFHPVEVMAFSATPIQDINNNRNFNRQSIGANSLMYGMNLELSTFVDATNTIVQNVHLYDELIGLIMAKTVIEALIFSYRTNATVRQMIDNISLEKLYAELNGKATTITGEVIYGAGLAQKVGKEAFRVKQSMQENKLTSIGTA